MRLVTIFSFFLFSSTSTTCFAQPFELDIVSIHAGGSTGDPENDYSLSLTFGLSMAAPGITISNYDLSFGFWNAIGTQAICPADFTGDGTLNFFDVTLFLSAYSAKEPLADFNKDGTYNFFDASDFLSAYNAGC
tara:strand:+ start:44136 stop:44537 length:402 start_codon:yes stop_codon:yes gene_type:complete